MRTEPSPSIQQSGIDDTIAAATEPLPHGAGAGAADAAVDAGRHANERIGDAMRLLDERLAPQRRVVRADDVIYRAGESFTHLYVLNSGCVKIVSLADDGREQLVGLKLRGDWLGFDGIADGRYACDANAVDTGDIRVLRYDRLIEAGVSCTPLLAALHEAMSRELGRDRESLMSLCTLPADARVAEFLRRWADSLARRGLRCDEISLRMTRAEIGNHLGMTLESVSRALSRLARDQIIAFAGKGRRDIDIPHVAALSAFVQRCIASPRVLQ